MDSPHILGGPGGDVIALPLELGGLPESVEVEGVILMRRSAFHVSLVCIGRIIEKFSIADPAFKDQVVQEFSVYIKKHPIEFLNFRDEFRLAEEAGKKSLVVMCSVANIDGFFDKLATRYERSILPPPLHVTLFTLGKDKGIFLIDQQDLEQLTHIIPKPEAITLRKV